MAKISINLATCESFGTMFDQARDKIREFLNYSGRPLSEFPHIQVYPADYKQLIGAPDRKFKKDARERTRALREQNKRDGVKGKVDPIEPDTVSDVHWGGVPVECGIKQSKPRRFEP